MKVLKINIQMQNPEVNRIIHVQIRSQRIVTSHIKCKFLEFRISLGWICINNKTLIHVMTGDWLCIKLQTN